MRTMNHIIMKTFIPKNLSQLISVIFEFFLLLVLVKLPKEVLADQMIM